MMVRRTKEEALATRELLLDCAEQVFLQRGVARSSLQDIADAAGVTRGAIYWHFGDKAALFQAMAERVDLPLERALEDLGHGEAPDPLVQLRRLALAPMALLADDEHARRIFTILLHRVEFVGEMAPVLQRQQQVLALWLQATERLFQAAGQRHELAAGIAPRAAALALLGLVDGLLRLATFTDDATPALEAAPTAIDALLAGLGGSGG